MRADDAIHITNISLPYIFLYKQAIEIKKLKMEWSEKMINRFMIKIDEKQAVGLEKEERRLDLLDLLGRRPFQ